MHLEVVGRWNRKFTARVCFMIFFPRPDVPECRATIKSVHHLSILSCVIQGALSSYLERLHLGCGGGQDKFSMSVLQRSESQF